VGPTKWQRHTELSAGQVLNIGTKSRVFKSQVSEGDLVKVRRIRDVTLEVVGVMWTAQVTDVSKRDQNMFIAWQLDTMCY